MTLNKGGKNTMRVSMSSKGEQQFLLECGLLLNSVLCGPSQSHFSLRGSVRILIRGLPNSPQCGLWGNLSSEHGRNSEALWKSDFSMKLLRQVLIFAQQLAVPDNRAVYGR